jgi:hypothetical protein
MKKKTPNHRGKDFAEYCWLRYLGTEGVSPPDGGAVPWGQDPFVPNEPLDFGFLAPPA